MERKQRSIKLNFIMNIILTMSTFIFPFITFPYISRILLPEGTGKVSFATSVISYFSMFAQMGIPTYGIRACAKVRDNREELTRVAHELLIINLVLDVITYIALFLSLKYVPRLRKEKALYVIISATILLTSIGMEWLYKALEQYTYITIRSVFFKFIALIMMFLLIKEKSDYVKYGAISIFAASASNLLNFLNAHKYIGFRPVGGYHFKRHFKPVAVFFSMACASTVYTHLDTIMLGFMKTDEEVGFYNAAVKIKTILVSIVTSLGTVLLPRASYYVEQGKWDHFMAICRKAIEFVLVVSIPMVAFFMMLSKEGILFLSGPAYLPAVAPMIIIMPTLLCIGLSNVFGIQMLVPMGREKTVLLSEICGALVDMGINMILIPPLGAAGAALGTLIAEIVVLVVQFNALKEDVLGMIKSIRIPVIIGGTSLSICVTFWIRGLHLPSFFILLISSVLFFATYFGLMVLLKEELVKDMLGQIIWKIKRRE